MSLLSVIELAPLSLQAGSPSLVAQAKLSANKARVGEGSERCRVKHTRPLTAGLLCWLTYLSAVWFFRNASEPACRLLLMMLASNGSTPVKKKLPLGTTWTGQSV